MNRNAIPASVRNWMPIVVALLGCLYLLCMCAWQSDEAYLTFRTVDNAINGHGLTWNAGERVQAYSHPLWMFLALFIHAIFGEIYFSSLGLSILLTLASVLILFNLGSRPAGLIATVILSLSAGFIDYAACGLETPLLYFLLVLFVWRLHAPEHRNKPFWLALIACLLGLTRLDALLFVAPVLLGLLFQTEKRFDYLGFVLIGFLPLVIWEAFSLVYYGSLIPNTALAKLNLNVGIVNLLLHGVMYLSDSLLHDPVSLLAMLAALRLASLKGSRQHKHVAFGVCLYLLYLVISGGDVMSGRFLAAPFLLAVANVTDRYADFKPRKRFIQVGWVIAFLAYGLLWPHARWTAGPDFGSNDSAHKPIRSTGIADQRALAYPTTGLVRILGSLVETHPNVIPPYPEAIQGYVFGLSTDKVRVVQESGFFGYFAGAEKIIIGTRALGDPLLARIPFRPDDNWRIGYVKRPLPRGYLASRQSGTNQLADPSLAQAYDAIRLVTTGELFTSERWVTIWRLHTGYYQTAFAKAASAQVAE